MSERATVSVLRKAAHELAGLPMIRGKCPEEQVVGCPIDALADRLEEAEDRERQDHEHIRRLEQRAEKAEREVETKERQRARLDEALSVVTAHRDRLEREVQQLEVTTGAAGEGV